ncbi:MAG: hypothetical protein ACHQC9_07110 [Alphaproteobacteria bacterium]
MIDRMDWLTTPPLIVGLIGNLSILALEALAEQLLTIFLAVLVTVSVSILAASALVWLWIRRTVGAHHVAPSLAPH